MAPHDARGLKAEIERLRAEVAELRLRREEAEGALEAIRTGQVESLVVDGPGGLRIFSLEGAHHAYRVLVEAMNEGAATLAEDGTVLYCNARFASMLEAPLHKVMGESIHAALGARSRALFAELLRKADEGQSRGEVALLTRGGKEVPAYLSISALDDGGRRVFCLVATDLTLQKQELDATLASMSEALLVFDADTRVIRANATAVRVLGFDPVGLERAELGRRTKLAWPDGRRLTEEELPSTPALRGEAVAHLRIVLERGGDERVFSVSSAPLRAGERVTGAVSVWHDMTEFERSQEALRQSESRYRALFENLPDAAFLTRADGRILAANPAAQRMFGMTEEELMRAGRAELVDTSTRQYQDALDERRRLGSYANREMVHIRKGGERFPTEVSSAVLPGGALNAFVIVRDITARKLAESALRASEAKYRNLFETIEEMVAVYEVARDDEGRIVERRLREANPAFLRAMGASSVEELRGKTSGEISGRAWAQAHLSAEGKAMETGEVQVQEVYHPESRRHYVSSIVRLDAEDYLCAAWDITESKRAAEALREANERLVEADRRKNDFLAMLSHELRNPLAPIRNSVYVVERAAPGGEQAKRAVSVIERQVTHMARLIDDLLDVTRISRGKIRLQREPLILNDLVRGTAEDLRDNFRRNGIQLEVRVTDAPLRVFAVRTRIAQVVGNLLQNAAKFTPGGGRTSLRLEAEGAEAVIQVRDTGVGMEANLLEKLFEPFMQGDQTLDRSRGGLGLGLALVKGLVELHGGSVSAASEGPGKGAVFTIRLPLELQLSPKATASAKPTKPTRSLRVLVVEDNEDAATSLKEVLELSGHAVALAFTGPEGVRMAKALLPEVILCDIGLPGLNGYGVAQMIRADPALRQTLLAALSGYAAPEDVERSREAGFDEHLAKPPSFEALEALLAQAPRRAAWTRQAGEEPAPAP